MMPPAMAPAGVRFEGMDEGEGEDKEGNEELELEPTDVVVVT